MPQLQLGIRLSILWKIENGISPGKLIRDVRLFSVNQSHIIFKDRPKFHFRAPASQSSRCTALRFLIGWFRITQYIPRFGSVLQECGDFTWRVSDCEELVGVYCRRLRGWF